MKDENLYLVHISESIDKIESYMDGLDFSAFMKNSLVQDAVLRNLQVLTKSTQRLSDKFKSQYPEIEWCKIAGLRNILVYDYVDIDMETVWGIVVSKLSGLQAVVRFVLQDRGIDGTPAFIPLNQVKTTFPSLVRRG